MPARALPRARSGGVQNKCEVKKLAWWKTPTAESRDLCEGRQRHRVINKNYKLYNRKLKWAFNGSLVNVRPKMLG